MKKKTEVVEAVEVELYKNVRRYIATPNCHALSGKLTNDFDLADTSAKIHDESIWQLHLPKDADSARDAILSDAAVAGRHALPVCGSDVDAAVAGRRALPDRKRLDHRGPLSIDVAGAWYFITICAEGHRPWVVDELKVAGRACRPATAAQCDGRACRPATAEIDVVAPLILREARECHIRGIWRLALFLVMPDHLHFIVHIPIGGRGATALPRVIANFKHLLSARYGLRFQRDFFDTRLRDNVHYDEKFRYICNNPVRKAAVAGRRALPCKRAVDWPYVIAFDRETGEERIHR